MIFNSIAFIIFLPIVFCIYWYLCRYNLKFQNLFLLAASYLFYGWWDYRFLSLIIISSLVDFLVGRYLEREDRPKYRKLLLFTSLSVNLGLLGFFKYFGFFVDSFAIVLSKLGLQANIWTLKIVLPVGISFYTFQTLSYTIDIYRKQIKATKDPISFFTFVAFFPQLVAGPIERAKNLLPQFKVKRTFDIAQTKDGLRQMLWGAFKKIVIADNIAKDVDYIFSNYANLDGVSLISGSFLFAVQIYCDFSGYSDIAIGAARLFGFRLRNNFAFPYFSRDIAEFWRRWHISLSSWFRDYVYIPLGGSRVNRKNHIRNIIITFTISGFWHGANWTFIIWGLLHGLYYIPILLSGSQKKNIGIIGSGSLFPSVREFISMLITFCFVLFAWIFFRAESLVHALAYIKQVFVLPIDPRFPGEVHISYFASIISSISLLAIEWLRRTKSHTLDDLNFPVVFRWVIYLSICISILIFGNFGEREFIYFQF